jgi:hypothetical protein
MVKFTEQLQFNMAITVWGKGKFTNGLKDSKEGGRVLMVCVLKVGVSQPVSQSVGQSAKQSVR